jgi:hypothetical protein
MLHDFGLADFEKFRLRFDLRARPGTARVADSNRTSVVMRHRPKHIDKFIFIFRLHVHPIRDVAQITDVEQAMMRRAIITTQSCAIHAEPDV